MGRQDKERSQLLQAFQQRLFSEHTSGIVLLVFISSRTAKFASTLKPGSGSRSSSGNWSESQCSDYGIKQGQ